MISQQTHHPRRLALPAYNPWKFGGVPFTAMASTIGLAGFVIYSLSLVLSGPRIGLWIARSLGLGVVFSWTRKGAASRIRGPRLVEP